MVGAGVIAVAGVVSVREGLAMVGRTWPGFLIGASGLVSFAPAGLSGRSTHAHDAVQVLAMENGRFVDDLRRIREDIAGMAPGTAVTFRLRRGSEVSRVVVPAKVFRVADLAAFHLVPVAAAVVLSLAALWAGLRARAPSAPAAAAVSLCVAAGVAAATFPDAVGDHRLLWLHHLALGLAGPALFHVALSFPEALEVGGERRLLLLGLYGAGLLFGTALDAASSDPSLYAPLYETLRLVVLDGVLVLGIRIGIGWVGAAGPERRRALAALAVAIVLAVVLAFGSVILLRLGRSLAGQMLGYAGVAGLGIALAVFAASAPPSPAQRLVSLRNRLTLIFLSSVQTGILVALVLFWLNGNWVWLLHDLEILHRERGAAERVLREPRRAEALDALRSAATNRSTYKAVEAMAAMRGRRAAVATAQSLRLVSDVSARQARLHQRLRWLSRVGGWLVVATVLVSFLQAGLFLITVRRWFAMPIQRLAEATRIIAQGRLNHRVPVETAGSELDSLGRDINSMAASLAAIQRRIVEEREARQTAAAAARDAERRRLARELHDGALQDLGAVKLMLEGHAGRDPLRAAVGAVSRVIAGIRRVVDDLRGPDLEGVSLPEAISAHAEILGRGRGVDVDVETAPDFSVPSWAVRDLYRIAQEAIANAVRHGAPRHLRIRLARDELGVLLEVADDGAGFDPASVVSSGGMLGMRERADALGADLEIDSGPGRGTRVRVRLQAY